MGSWSAKNKSCRLLQRWEAFSLGEADLLRRAISKKDQLKIDKLQARFVMGAEKKRIYGR